jgi:hypothetical protein
VPGNIALSESASPESGVGAGIDEDTATGAKSVVPFPVSGTGDRVESTVSPESQRHVWRRGMAAVTTLQWQSREEGCGQLLSGRPGLLTGTMTRSLACWHFVDRWPRIHGSQAIFCPLMMGMTAVRPLVGRADKFLLGQKRPTRSCRLCRRTIKLAEISHNGVTWFGSAWMLPRRSMRARAQFGRGRSEHS